MQNQNHVGHVQEKKLRRLRRRSSEQTLRKATRLNSWMFLQRLNDRQFPDAGGSQLRWWRRVFQ